MVTEATTKPTKTRATTARPRRPATTTAATPVDTNARNGRGGSAGGTSAGALIGAAAAGVAVGLVANLGRKAAVQAPTLLAGDWDEALATEHKLTLKVFDALEATTEKNTTRRSMHLAQLKHMLAKHALQEENVIYPALREAGQTEAADHLNNDHGYVKQYLYELENMPKESPGFLTKLRQFRTDLEKHMGEEENDLFPSLKGKLTPEKNKKLTATMNKEGFKLA